MKKLCSLLLVLCLLFPLSACGNNDSAQDTDNGSSTTQNQADVTDTSSTEQDTDSSGSTTDTVGSLDSTDALSSTTGTPSTTTESETSKPSTTTKPKTSTPSTTTKPETSKPSTTTHTHSYSGATCTAPAKCSCGATEGSALGHKWQKATCQAPKTCSVCKATEGVVAAHNWNEATCSAPKTCEVCKKTEGEKAEHTFDSEGKCKWCKQILPIPATELPNSEYWLVKPIKTWSPISGDADADGIRYFKIDFKNIEFGSEECISGDFVRDYREQEWLDNARIMYNGDDYYSWQNGYGGNITSKLSNNHIVVSCGKMVVELEMLSNNTLRVVSVAGDNYRNFIQKGDIFE